MEVGFKLQYIRIIIPGGTFTLFDGRINSVLKALPESNNVCSYIDMIEGCTKN